MTDKIKDLLRQGEVLSAAYEESAEQIKENVMCPDIQSLLLADILSALVHQNELIMAYLETIMEGER